MQARQIEMLREAHEREKEQKEELKKFMVRMIEENRQLQDRINSLEGQREEFRTPNGSEKERMKRREGLGRTDLSRNHGDPEWSRGRTTRGRAQRPARIKI